MTTALFSTIILLSLIYVLIPLFTEANWPFLKRGMLSELRSARKEGILAISDLDDEYAMGKLTRDDYARLRDSLKHEVAPVLKKEMEISGAETPVPGQNGLTPSLLREVIRICGLKHS